ncbi:hypothetical protein Btru_057199 [Bulinus truncatus]|nr:hypothetical protein Btru_057199 [Bulinus truncatus]
MKFMCGCILQIQLFASTVDDKQKMGYVVDPTLTTDDFRAQPFNSDMRTTTEDICDLLCSVQLGGDACLCSHPSLPGK